MWRGVIAALLCCGTVCGQTYVQNIDLGLITRTDGVIPVGDGSKFVGESGATLRTSIGLGSIATQNSNAVTITGGTINGTAIGGTTAAAGAFTTLSATGKFSALNGGSVTMSLGADYDGSTITNAKAKSARVTTPCYDTTGREACLLYAYNGNGSNTVMFGGGTSVANAATSIQFFTGAAADTQTGTSRMTIASDGTVTLPADNQKLALGAAGATDSYLQWNGSGLDVYSYGLLKISARNARFLHNFQHPTGNGAVPLGWNTFLGELAGNLTTGSTATQTYHSSGNTGVGAYALNAVTTGYYNTAIGPESQKNLTTGAYNVAIGMSTLRANIAGTWNMAIGTSALTKNTGSFNAAVGSSALSENTTGTYNTAIGHHASSGNVDGAYNVGIGVNSGKFIADGSTANTTSDYATYVGADAKAGADGNQNETVVGYGAIGAGSNTVRLGNSSVTLVQTDGKIDTTKAIEFRPGSSVTPTDNGDVVFELTDNTTLTVRAKGSDGTVRSVALTLAP